MRALAWILLGLLLAGAASPSDAVALVTDVSGPARVTRGKVEFAAMLGQSLREGDLVDVKDGSTVKLILMRGPAAGRQEALKGPCAARLGSSGAVLVRGPASARSVLQKETSAPLVPRGGIERMAGRTLRSELRPRMDWASPGTPRWRWAEDVRGPFLLTVWEGDRLVWEERTDGHELVYRGPKLREDVTYRWEFSRDDPWATPFFAPMRVPSRASRATVEAARRACEAMDPDDPARHVLLLDLYLEHMLLEEAADEAREALRLRPGDPNLEHTLTEILYLLGRPTR